MVRMEATKEQKLLAQSAASELADKFETVLLELLVKGYGEATASVSVAHGSITIARCGYNETFKPSLN